jgi:PAS domain S-box-containing protein
MPPQHPPGLPTQAHGWWQRLRAQIPDIWAMLAPLAAVFLFLAAIVSAFGYLRLEEIEREHEALRRDMAQAQQKLRLRLVEQHEQLVRLARQIDNQQLHRAAFAAQAEALIAQYPALQSLGWLDDQGRVQASVGANNFKRLDSSTAKEERGRPGQGDVASVPSSFRLQPPQQASGTQAAQPATLQLLVPLHNGVRGAGMLLAQYALEGLLRYDVPIEVSARYAISLRDANDVLLAGMAQHNSPASGFLSWASPVNSYQAPISLADNRLVLHGQAYKTSLGVIGSGLFWLASALSVMTAWMLVANWRHTRKQLQAQQALVAETAFRRAMENSMLTGMRALDLRGRITYVNAAFCRMTGWSESELVGQLPPFPYWPEADREQLTARLEEELAGRTVHGGVQVRVKRRDGSLFDARLYVSPLIDSHQVQSGWMTSMTDITEPNRVREQLSAAHQRFTTVLEALDASVSVAPLGGDELLFANRLYRLWFGTQASGHQQLAAQAGVPMAPTSQDAQDAVDAFAGLPTSWLPEAEAESAEICLEQLGKWLEVRTRYLSWVDGRLVQMVIATDISARRLAEEQSAAQIERAHSANRLITMGEMASSVAHELNQPLTAINNYCTGMVSRIRSQQISTVSLLETLEKTAHQAHRAGQIIQRIRSFVKRSEPNRTPSNIANIVEEAVELAGIELRRRNVRLTHQVEAQLPLVMVDPILIEQVLVNLLKNAAESIDAAQRPTAQRSVNLQVALQDNSGKAMVEFRVTDTGQGLMPEVTERLYEAFYSTKPDGMGIGLSLCRSIVESHQGRMQAQNIYNGDQVTGCCFVFWLPLSHRADTTEQTSGA